MKTFVFTNKEGQIVGCFQQNTVEDPNIPKVRPITNDKSNIAIHEIEWSTRITSETSVKELYEELAKLINAKSY